MNINMKYIFRLLSLAALVVLFASCEETKEESEFHNWKARNDHFIDSIANVAKKNADGNWTIFKAHILGDDFGMDKDNKYYIYVQKLIDGTGTEYPEYNDSVRVHYSGRLIPSDTYPAGYNFDKSYNSSIPDLATDVPTLFCPNSVVVGFATAVMNMVVGDRWRVYIPYYLGYGSESSAVPAYSTLIYDMQLAKIYKYGIDKDTRWWVKRR